MRKLRHVWLLMFMVWLEILGNGDDGRGYCYLLAAGMADAGGEIMVSFIDSPYKV